MPATASSADNPDYQETASDAFTRLSIATCPADDGTRPINPNWVGCEVGYRSPAFEFHPTYPLPVNQLSTIRILVRNFGTMDATAVFFECAYNLFIGNQNQGMVPIQSKTLDVVPSGGSTTVEVPWTPPDAKAVHACLHARVIDVYSLLTYPMRVSSWNAFTNPQAANRNVRLIRVSSQSKGLAIPFLARNDFDVPLRAKALVTRIDERARFRDIEERFPLPFRLEPVAEPALRVGPGQPIATSTSRTRTSTPVVRDALTRDASGLRLAGVGAGGLWPRPEVAAHFRHANFGFATKPVFVGLAQQTFTPRKLSAADVDAAKIESYIESQIEPKVLNQELYVLIPAAELPPRGRRTVYQVDYQVGADRPVTHLIYLQY